MSLLPRCCCSHVNEAKDPWAGLLGPIIITNADNAKEDGAPKDVDRYDRGSGCVSAGVARSCFPLPMAQRGVM